MMKRNIYVLFICLSILDMLTTFTASLPLSLGALVRSLMMAVLFIYLFLHDKKKRMYFLLAYSVIALSFLLNFYSKTPFIFTAEIQYYMKVSYLLTMLWSILYSFKKLILDQSPLLHAANLAFILIGFTYWIAFFTNTYTKSYSYIKTGNAGWYFSANEWSVILLVLFALTLIRFLHTLDGAAVLGVLLGVSMFPMVGTKTALYGGLILFIPIVIYVLSQKKWLHTSILITLSTLLFIYIPNTSGGANEEMKSETEAEPQTMLSSRDIYLTDTMTAYQQAPVSQKIFGLGYGGNYSKAPKTIEMDFYDLFFSLGIVGSIVIIIPFAQIVRQLVPWQSDFIYLYSIGVLGLIMGIAFVAGHVLFAPAVASYVAIFTIWTGSERHV